MNIPDKYEAKLSETEKKKRKFLKNFFLDSYYANKE